MYQLITYEIMHNIAEPDDICQTSIFASKILGTQNKKPENTPKRLINILKSPTKGDLLLVF